MTTSEKIATAIKRQDRDIHALVSAYMAEKMKTAKTRQAFFKSIGAKTNEEGKLVISR